MKSMRWPSMRPSVAKWPRASRGMLRLRPPAWATVTAFCEAGVAEADAGVILSAIFAMKVPRPIRMAAMTRMLRMTPPTSGLADFTTPAAQPRLTTTKQPCHFGEKDERSVNATPGNDEGQVPRGLTRLVGIAFAGSSGQGCRG
jgi:hypothetical protein